MTTNQPSMEVPMDETAEGPASVKPFAQFVQEMNNGAVHDDLSRQLQEIVAAAMDTGRKGTLTLRLTASPQKDELTMLVTADVVAKLPKHAAKPALFFPDEDGNLLRSDPRQLDMSALREVPAQPAPRDIAGRQAAASGDAS
jgi:hypothetical protein